MRTTALLDGDALDIDLPEPVTWVVANADGHGFYRVRASAPLREALVAQAQDVLSDVERYGLVDDTWASVLAGTTSVEDFLDLADGFAGETDVSVWRRLLAGLDQVDRLVDGEAGRRSRPGCARWSAPRSSGSGWEERPTTPTATASCAAR